MKTNPKQAKTKKKGKKAKAKGKGVAPIAAIMTSKMMGPVAPRYSNGLPRKGG